MYQMLIVKDWNYLTTHLKKLATHKCVATPWLRTTALDCNSKYISNAGVSEQLKSNGHKKDRDSNRFSCQYLCYFIFVTSDFLLTLSQFFKNEVLILLLQNLRYPLPP